MLPTKKTHQDVKGLDRKSKIERKTNITNKGTNYLNPKALIPCYRLIVYMNGLNRKGGGMLLSYSSCYIAYHTHLII